MVRFHGHNLFNYLIIFIYYAAPKPFVSKKHRKSQHHFITLDFTSEIIRHHPKHFNKINGLHVFLDCFQFHWMEDFMDTFMEIFRNHS
jgi:hypothetical protein